MPDCASIEPLVTPYVDGAARRRSNAQAVETHLALPALPRRGSRPNARCRELLQDAPAALSGEHAPIALRAGAPASPQPAIVRLSLNAGAVVRSPCLAWWRATRAAADAADDGRGAVVLVVRRVRLRATGSSTRVMAAELTADHVKCFMMNAVLGTHETADAVESSMASGFDWHVQLPEHPERADLELVGARPCLYGEGKVAHIMYRHHGHPVSLFMLPRTARADELVEVMGHQAAIWSVGTAPSC